MTEGLPNNPSESTKRRNPHLFTLQSQPVSVTVAKKVRIRQSSKPLLNKLESEYLKMLQSHSGCEIFPQAVRFRLGNGIWYKPDFIVITPMHDVLGIEVKGPKAFRGGFENLKVAASLYKWIRWKLVWKDEQGEWTTQPVLP